MNLLILNFTGNKNGFEDKIEGQIFDYAQCSHTVKIIRAHGLQDVTQLPSLIHGQAPDMSILIAHGACNSQGLILDLGVNLPRADTPEFLASILGRTRIFESHKILLICEGIAAESLAHFNTDFPNSPVLEDSRVIGKISSIDSNEATHVCIGLLEFLQEKGRPSGPAVDAAFKEAKKMSTCPEDWLCLQSLRLTSD